MPYLYHQHLITLPRDAKPWGDELVRGPILRMASERTNGPGLQKREVAGVAATLFEADWTMKSLRDASVGAEYQGKSPHISRLMPGQAVFGFSITSLQPLTDATLSLGQFERAGFDKTFIMTLTDHTATILCVHSEPGAGTAYVKSLVMADTEIHGMGRGEGRPPLVYIEPPKSDSGAAQ